MKRLVSILLTLIFALGFLSPATAAVNWEQFIVVEQPRDQYLPDGGTFTFSPVLYVPAGVTDIAYQWYRVGPGGSSAIEGATGPVFTCAPGDPDYPADSIRFSCVIQAYENGELGGSLLTYAALAQIGDPPPEPVEREKTFRERMMDSLGYIWEWVKGAFGSIGGFFGSVVNWVLVLVFAPLELLIGLAAAPFVICALIVGPVILAVVLVIMTLLGG